MNDPFDVRKLKPVVELEGRARRLVTACGNGDLVWREWGEGHCVVLQHGGFGSWLHWVRNVEFLAQSYRVLAVDMPGLGESALPEDARTPAGLAEPIVRGLESLLAEGESFDLVGFSFGGLVAGQVAARMGARVRSLTLVGSSGLGLRRRRFELIARTPDMDRATLEAALRYNVGALMLHHANSVDELAVAIQGYNDGRCRVRSRRMSMGDSLWQVLPRIRGRLNGIWGEHDSTATPWMDYRRSLLRSVHPDVEFEVIEDAGHWVQYEAPARFNTTLARMLQAGAGR
jgi:pimeloyl-ACP methyl ester carboxylesterase